MRYKVGDYVQVRKGLIGGKDYKSKEYKGCALYFNPSMSEYVGKIFKVTDICPQRYSYPERYILNTNDGLDWVWSAEMLVPVNHEKTISYLLEKRAKI